ncbi:permease [Paludisphaera rhizosphaerae]|uniref:permease n=1 Tax=Paludisphaera rhizosphaerae TaxID=2711216 RepID=UPI0013EC77EF|nr:permease [Paludisphaera rhizosphaerae]
MIDPLAAFFGGLLVRAARVVVEASPYLLLGLATSAILRSMVGPARLRRVFGEGRWTGPVRAWAAATLLPVCSLGVLPVLRELRRSGVRRDAVLTFALAAPMFNPLTLLTGFSYLGPGVMARLTAASAMVSVVVGMAVGRSREAETVDGSTPLPGRDRQAAGAVHFLREASGPVWFDVGVGLIVACIVSAAVSPTWLAEGTNAGDPMAPARLAAIAAPAYVSPEAGVVMLPEMVKFRQSAGAMLVLVVLGIGVTAGHLTWIGGAYGRAVVVRWLTATVVATFLAAWAIESLDTPVGSINPDNDHYDALVSPISHDHPSLVGSELGRIWERTGSGGLAAPVALALSLAAGVALRAGRLGPRSTFEDWSEGSDRQTEGVSAAIYERPLPRWLVWAIGASAGITLFVVGGFMFFPSPDEAFRDMSVIRADYFGEIDAADVEVPIHHLDLWERQASRLPIGAAIRFRRPDAEAQRLTQALLEAVRGLREATRLGDRSRARTLFREAQTTYDGCRQAYDVRF